MEELKLDRDIVGFVDIIPCGEFMVNTLAILLDGAADDRIPELNYKTPLEAIRKPFIDGLASRGIYGCTDSKEYTHLFLLELLTGNSISIPRGVVEALSFNISLDSGYVAYRLSPAIIENGFIKWIYNLSKENELRIFRAVNDSLRYLESPKIYFYSGCKGVLIVKSSKILDFPSPPSPSMLNIDLDMFRDFITSIASKANGLTLIPWGGGKLEPINVKSKVKLLTIISKSPSVLGIGNILGFSSIRVSNSVSEGLDKSLEYLKTSNVLLHVEEIDDISHTKSFSLKMSILEDIDLKLRSKIEEMEGFRVAIIIDHGTSSLTGKHLDVNVPFTVSKVTGTLTFKVRFCEGIGDYTPLKSLAEVLFNGY